MDHRLCPARALPARPYVPGVSGTRPPEPPPAIALEPARWQHSEPFLFGCDLFNHGFFWEAHAEWEALWHAAGRRGDVAVLLRALIRLAAAGVKRAQSNANGARRHVAAAKRALEALGAKYPTGLCGIDLSTLAATLSNANEGTASMPDVSLPMTT